MGNLEREQGNIDKLPRGLRRLKRLSEAYVGRPEETLHYVEVSLAEGESPIGPPPEYPLIRRELELGGAFADAGSRYPKITLEPAIQSGRERFGISQKPVGIISGGGGDEILERIVSWGKSSKTRIWGIGPQFPNVDVFASRTEGMVAYGSDSPPLELPMDEIITRAIEKRKLSMGLRKDNVICYVNNANNPTGGVISPDVMDYLMDYCEDEDITIVVDEVHGDPLPDNESAIRKTEDHYNVIAIRSLSKTVGLSGERIGYAYMSEGIGELYKKVQRPFDIDGPKMLLINRIMNNDILLPHIKNAVATVVPKKRDFMKGLDEAHIKYLPTDERTNIILVDGEEEGFAHNLTLPVVSGEGYKYSHERMNSSLARFSIFRNFDTKFYVSRAVLAKETAGAA